MRRTALAVGLAISVLPLTAVQNLTMLEHPAIGYYETEPTDAVAKLSAKLAAGESLDWDSRQGYLKSVLRALDIDPSSQVLVASKTSLQSGLISPDTPRAIYFNDHAYVAWVQGGPLLELSGIDPVLGATFYVLEQAGQGRALQRENDVCVQCHNPAAPGHVLISAIPNGSGLPLFHDGALTTTDRSPLEERWGGWYVTGTHGEQLHMGNLIVRNPRDSIDLRKGANVTDLSRFLDTDKYLTPHSDIVALMVMGHQVYVQNLMTRLNYASRKAIYEGARTEAPYKEAAEDLVKAMLFAEETPLSGRIAGTSGFAEQFQRRGPFDSRGRSLRELDLSRRLFRYPLSYLIYSSAFAGLPRPAREYVTRRLSEVLDGRDSSPEYRHLSLENRRAIVEILRETHNDFAGSDQGDPS